MKAKIKIFQSEYTYIKDVYPDLLKQITDFFETIEAENILYMKWHTSGERFIIIYKELK